MCVWYSWSLDTLIFPASRGGREGVSVNCQKSSPPHQRSRVLVWKKNTWAQHLFIRTFGGRRSPSRVLLEWASLFYYYFFQLLRWKPCGGTFGRGLAAVTPAENQPLHAASRRAVIAAAALSERSTLSCSTIQNHSRYAHFEKWRQQIKNIFLSTKRGGREAWRCGWDRLFVCCGWIIINTVPAQLLPVANVRTTQKDIVRMMESVDNFSTQTNHVMASNKGWPSSVCMFFRKVLKTPEDNSFKEFYKKICFLKKQNQNKMT